MKFADLHLHTTYSDGFYSPEQLLKEVSRCQFSTIAITDHDTIEGSDEADGLADQYKIEIIPGVEMTAATGSKEFHILGYCVDKKDDQFLANLAFNTKKRLKRMKRIIEKLNHFGLKLDFEEFKEYAGKATLGRLKLAHFLHKKKLVSSPQEAFEKYIGKKQPGHEKGEYLSASETIQSIRKSGGIAVWAHPGLNETKEYFSRMLDWGIQGLEVYYPNHSEEQVANLNYLSQKYGLLVTGGSDCHGKAKERVMIGEVKLPYSYIKLLKEAANKCD